MKNFKTITPENIGQNAMQLIGKEWMLISAGSLGAFNMMTASWGGLGVLWGQPVAFIFIRPHRYTREFVEKHASFTLNFFEEDKRDILNTCGSESGRDIDKMHIPGLTAIESPSGSVCFSEAQLVLDCRRIYSNNIEPGNILDPAVHDWYPEKDYHIMYIGQIQSCFAKA